MDCARKLSGYNVIVRVAGEEQTCVGSCDKGGLRIDTSLIDFEVESKDNTSVTEETSSASCTLIERVVAHAYETFDLKPAEKLTKDQFTQWVSSDAKVASLFNSVFSACKSPSTSPPPGPHASL